MDTFVFAAVLFAAACHAGWNATIKRGLDPLVTTAAISIGAAIVSLALLPWVGLPAAAAWPWVIASVLIHLVYFASLIESYRAGDMGQVYPIARGAAPLMTATATTAFVGERLSVPAWLGIVLLVAGVLLLSLRGGRRGAGAEKGSAMPDRRAVGFALFTAVTVCAYSVVDGVGARAAGSPNAYSVALFIGIGPVIARLCAGATGRRHRCGVGAPRRPWARRRHAAARLLRHRHLGDDIGADRARRGVARNQRAVRRRDRGGVPEGALALRAASSRRC